MNTSRLHLGPDHALAGIASSHCIDHRTPLIGGVACGACWERAIRDDEQFAVEEQLPRQMQTDPTYIDYVAVDRACAGERLPLTRAELTSAIQQLRSDGNSLKDIAFRLHVSERVVASLTRAGRTRQSAEDSTGGVAA